MTDPRSDEELMQAYASDDVAAFELLYQRHRRPLFGFLQRGIGHNARAEECFQEVWSRIIKSRHRYQPDARFSTWMYQIAHNLMIDQFRRQRPELSDSDSAEAVEREADAAPGPDGLLSEFQLRRRVQLALAELPEDQRIAVRLRIEQEFSLEQIADITGVGRETVKSRLRYAIDKLRARLGGTA